MHLWNCCEGLLQRAMVLYCFHAVTNGNILVCNACKLQKRLHFVR